VLPQLHARCIRRGVGQFLRFCLLRPLIDRAARGVSAGVMSALGMAVEAPAVPGLSLTRARLKAAGYDFRLFD